MIIGTSIVAILLPVIVAATMRRRRAHYRRLARRVDAAAGTAVDSGIAASLSDRDFRSSIADFPGFLERGAFAALLREVEALALPERSYVPTHKKGGTVAYATIIDHAPGILALYQSRALRKLISDTVGIAVRPTPLHDQNSLSVLVYERPGDHIGWHFDHNFYRGRHFTVLLAMVNRGHCPDGLSHARLAARIDGVETEVTTAPNTLVLFEGARLRHKVSPIEDGERRIVISMTFCADARADFAQAVARRLKDTAFFGVRALWT